MRNKTTTLFALTLGAALVAAGCGFDQGGVGSEQIDDVQSRLLYDNGGFEMNDEAPTFVAPEEALLAPTFDYDRDLVVNAAQLLAEIPELPEGLLDSTTAANAPAPAPTPAANSATGAAADPTRPAPDANVCARALFTGRWKALRDGYGVWRGVIVNRDGRVIGFSRGIYGRGHFFGKLVHRGGKAWGLMKGLYRSGHFKGHLKTRDGVVAGVRGRYGDGKFAGLIATRCAPQPPPSPCVAPAVLDVCPAVVRVCRSVTAANTGSAPNNNLSNSAATNTTTTQVCHVRCAEPVCRPPHVPAAGSAATPSNNTAAGR
ncbi:MAG: hypothetical protein KC503_00600 [Myxococcales bacterium]|nr:hypothetical protein [Myxococcales bacterium]